MKLEQKRKFELLKWYFDESRIFPNKAIIFKTKISIPHEKKNADYNFQISLFIPKNFKFLKCAN